MLGGATEKPALNFLVLDLSVDSIGSGLSVKALLEKSPGCLLGSSDRSAMMVLLIF